MAAIAAAWTSCEEIWVAVLGIMLGAESESAIKAYIGLQSASGQAKLLKSFGSDHLSPTLREKMNALLRAEQPRATERNRVIHGPWYHSKDYPDCLILGELGHLARMTSRISNAALGGYEYVHKGMSCFIYTINDY